MPVATIFMGTDPYFRVVHARSVQSCGVLELNDLNIYPDGAIEADESIWWNYRQLSAFEVSPGATGATFIPPDANTAGGYQLDAITEKLYFGADMHEDWDGQSNPTINIYFEVNIDNTGGLVTDEVDLVVICQSKAVGELVCKTQTLSNPLVVGQSPQYQMFEAQLELDFDSGPSPVEVGDVVACTLNLDTGTSDVDNVIVNHLEFVYPSRQPAIEI